MLQRPYFVGIRIGGKYIWRFGGVNIFAFYCTEASCEEVVISKGSLTSLLFFLFVHCSILSDGDFRKLRQITPNLGYNIIANDSLKTSKDYKK